MTRDEITKAAENILEWPTDKHDTVTLTSCIFFAEYISERTAKALYPVGKEIGGIKMMIRNEIATQFGAVSGQNVDDVYNVLMPVIRSILNKGRS